MLLSATCVGVGVFGHLSKSFPIFTIVYHEYIPCADVVGASICDRCSGNIYPPPRDNIERKGIHCHPKFMFFCCYTGVFCFVYRRGRRGAWGIAPDFEF